jgi:hypothetical protein
MSQQALSPLMQVTEQPSLVYSHLHGPQHRLIWQQVIPPQVQVREHIPSQRALHRFCKVPQATSSSHEQLSFMPPLHFSAFIVHRGSTHGIMAGAAA